MLTHYWWEMASEIAVKENWLHHTTLGANGNTHSYSTNYTQQNQVTNFHTTMGLDLREDLQKFWELKELPNNWIHLSRAILRGSL